MKLHEVRLLKLVFKTLSPIICNHWEDIEDSESEALSDAVMEEVVEAVDGYYLRILVPKDGIVYAIGGFLSKPLIFQIELDGTGVGFSESHTTIESLIAGLL